MHDQFSDIQVLSPATPAIFPVRPVLFTLENVGAQYETGVAAEKRGIFIDKELLIYSGRMTAIIGGSGSGKTTLLHLLAGFTEINTKKNGALFKLNLAGEREPVNMLAGGLENHHRRRLGFVFQFSHLLRNATCTANLALPCAIHNLKIDRSQVEQTLEAFFKHKSEDKLTIDPDRRVRTVSGGEAQRLALGRALIHDPDIVLADEPTGSLDPQKGEEIIASLREWREASKRRSVIWVTHNLDDVCRYADDVIVLTDGKLSPSQARWPVANPKNADVLRDWMDGKTAPPSSATFSGSAVTPSAAFKEAFKEGRVKRQSFLGRLLPSSLPLKLALAELFAGGKADKTTTTGLNRALGYRQGGMGFTGFFRAISQGGLSFSKGSTLAALALSLVIFFAVYHARAVFSDVFERMQSDPDVSHVLANGSFEAPNFLIYSDNIADFRESFQACLKAKNPAEDRSCITDPNTRKSAASSGFAPRIYGRWIEREDIEITEINDPACERLLPGLPIKLMAADATEPAMVKRFSPHTAGGNEKFMLLEPEAANDFMKRYRQKTLPAQVCLKLHGKWTPVYVKANNTGLPPDPDFRAIDAAITTDYFKNYKDDITSNNPVNWKREFPYKRIVIYFSPEDIPTVKAWAFWNKQLLATDAFNKVEQLLKMSQNVQIMTSGFYVSILLFIGIFMGLTYWNYILTNEKFFCVLRAFGASRFFMSLLMIYQLLILCALACGAFFIALWLLNMYVWPRVVSQFQLPAKTPDLIASVPFAFSFFAVLSVAVAVALTLHWCRANRFIGDRLKVVG